MADARGKRFEPPPRIDDLESFLSSYEPDPDVGVGIITSEGFTVWVNDRAAEIFHGTGAKAADYIGTWWRDVLPEAWVAERLALLRHMKHDDRPMVMRVVWRGRQHMTWVRRLDPETVGGPDRFLTLTRRMSGDGAAQVGADERFGLVQSEISDLGPLAALSPHEIELMVLLARGVRDGPIARTLYPSEQALDRLRARLTSRIGWLSPDEIGSLADSLGLTRADASRQRV